MTETNTIKVWDPLVRIFHWGLAGCFLIAYVTEDEILQLHVAAGYTIIGLIGFRLLWGFIGPEHARFSDFVRGPGQVLGYLKEIVTGHPRRYLGHNPAGGAMVIALLSSIAATTLSGLALLGAAEMSGPLAGMLAGTNGEAFEEVHEFFANLTLFLVVLHLIGVAAASRQHRENLARSMLTGTKPAEPAHD